MTKVALPISICQQISTRAVQFAREDIASRGWSEKSIEAVTAFPGEGQVGLKTSKQMSPGSFVNNHSYGVFADAEAVSHRLMGHIRLISNPQDVCLRQFRSKMALSVGKPSSLHRLGDVLRLTSCMEVCGLHTHRSITGMQDALIISQVTNKGFIGDSVRQEHLGSPPHDAVSLAVGVPAPVPTSFSWRTPRHVPGKGICLAQSLRPDKTRRRRGTASSPHLVVGSTPPPSASGTNTFFNGAIGHRELHDTLVGSVKGEA